MWPPRRFVAWKSEGTVTVENGDQNQNFPDATLEVLIEGRSLTITENARYIPSWFFVAGRNAVVAETTFEHGPSTFVLYDLGQEKRIESCGQDEISRCLQLTGILHSQK